MPKEQFNIKILINQNLALAGQLANQKHQFQRLKNVEVTFIEWIKIVLQYFHSILKEYQNFNYKSISLYELGLKLSTITNNLHQGEKQLLEKIRETNRQFIQQKDNTNNCIFHQLFQKYLTRLEVLQQENVLLRRRCVKLNEYETKSIDAVINGEHLCYCGGVKLEFYKQKLQEQRKRINSASKMEIEVPAFQHQEQMKSQKTVSLHQFNILSQQLKQSQAKVQILKTKNKASLDYIIRSQPFQILKNECKQLLIFNAQLITKLNNHKEFLKQIQIQRKKQIQSLMQSFGKPKLSFHRQSILDGSDIGNILTQMREQSSNCQQQLGRAVQVLQKIMRYQRQILNSQIDEERKEQSRNKMIQQEQIDVVQRDITFILDQPQALALSKKCKIFLLPLKRSWSNVFRYLKKQNQQALSFGKLSEYYSKLDMVVKYLKDNRRQLKNLLDDVKNIPMVYQGFDKKFNQLSNKLADLQFSYGEYRAFEMFRKLNYEKQIKNMEDRLSMWTQKETQLKEIIENRVTLLALIDTQQVQFRTEQSKYLTIIQNYKKIQQKLNSENQYLLGEITKIAQQKQQMKRVIGRMQNTNVQSEVQIELKMELQSYKRKIHCACGRGHQANIALKECKHIICKACVDSIISTRKRCCPICNTKFTQKPHEFKYN